MCRCCKALSQAMLLCNKTTFLEMCCCSLCTYLAFSICLVSYLTIEAWAFEQNLHQPLLLFSLSWYFWPVTDTLPLGYSNWLLPQKTHQHQQSCTRFVPVQSEQNQGHNLTLWNTISSMITKDTLSRWKLIWKQKEQLKKTWFPDFF